MEQIDWAAARLAIKTLSAIDDKRYDDADDYTLGLLLDDGYIEAVYTAGQTTMRLTGQGQMLLGYLVLEEAYAIHKGLLYRGDIKVETYEHEPE